MARSYARRVPAQLVPFLLFVIVLTIVPGPDTALGLRNSALGGSTAMWWTGLGCCTGLLVHAAVSVAGLSALLAASAAAYSALKIAGAAYLVWLGASSLWKSRHGARAEPGPPEPHLPGGHTLSRATAFRQGLISNLLNPKIVLLFLTLLPQFVSQGEPRARTSLVLSLVFVAVALVWWRTISWLIGSLRRVLTRPRVRLLLERVTGAILIAVGLRVALDGV